MINSCRFGALCVCCVSGVGCVKRDAWDVCRVISVIGVSCVNGVSSVICVIGVSGVCCVERFALCVMRGAWGVMRYALGVITAGGGRLGRGARVQGSGGAWVRGCETTGDWRLGTTKQKTAGDRL